MTGPAVSSQFQTHCRGVAEYLLSVALVPCYHWAQQPGTKYPCDPVSSLSIIYSITSASPHKSVCAKLLSCSSSKNSADSQLAATGLSLLVTTISPFQSIRAEKTMQPKFSTCEGVAAQGLMTLPTSANTSRPVSGRTLASWPNLGTHPHTAEKSPQRCWFWHEVHGEEQRIFFT